MSPATAATTTTTTTSTSRWSPTAEQLMILEEMYRRGITTPKASQIQHITSYLSQFGKIEGKNVFYWFQNHKARDRQKLRRQLIAVRQQQQQQQQQQQELLHQRHSTMPTMTYHQYHHHQYLSHDQYYSNYNTSTTNPTASGSSAFQPLSVYNSLTKYFPDQGLSWSAEKILEGDDIGGECSCCTKPLRTLELFPTKSSSSIKDEYNVTTTSQASLLL